MNENVPRGISIPIFVYIKFEYDYYLSENISFRFVQPVTEPRFFMNF